MCVSKRPFNVTTGPGIYQDPAWIISEVERLIERRGARTVAGSLAMLARQHGWGHLLKVNLGVIVVRVWALEPRNRRTYYGTFDSEAPIR